MRELILRAEVNDPGDEVVHIHEVLVPSGEYVQEGEILFVAEGAKSLFDVCAPAAGVFVASVAPGASCPIGAEIAKLLIDDK